MPWMAASCSDVYLCSHIRKQMHIYVYVMAFSVYILGMAWPRFLLSVTFDPVDVLTPTRGSSQIALHGDMVGI